MENKMIKLIIVYSILSFFLLQCASLKNRKACNSERIEVVEKETTQPIKDTVDCNKSIVLPAGTKVNFKSLLVIDSSEFYVGANDGYLLHFKNGLFQFEKLLAKDLQVDGFEQMFLDSSGVIVIHANDRVWKKKCGLLALDTTFQINAEKLIKDNLENLYICNKKEIFKHTKIGWQKMDLPLVNHHYEYYGTLGDAKLLAVSTEWVGGTRGSTSEIHIFKDSCWKAYKSAPFYSVDCFFGNPEINDIYATGWRFRNIPDTLNDSYFMQFIEPVFYFNGTEWVNFADEDYFTGDIIYVDYKEEKHFDIYIDDGDVYSFNKGQWDTVYIHKMPYTLSSRKKKACRFGRKLLAISEYEISIYDGNGWKVFFSIKDFWDK